MFYCMMHDDRMIFPTAKKINRYRYVQGMRIWSHLVLKVIVFRSECESACLVMDFVVVRGLDYHIIWHVLSYVTRISFLTSDTCMYRYSHTRFSSEFQWKTPYGVCRTP